MRERADRIGLEGEASDGAMPDHARQPLPPPDPVYQELQGAKAYIASLERDNAALRAVAEAAAAPPSGSAGPLQRLRALFRR